MIYILYLIFLFLKILNFKYHIFNHMNIIQISKYQINLNIYLIFPFILILIQLFFILYLIYINHYINLYLKIINIISLLHHFILTYLNI